MFSSAKILKPDVPPKRNSSKLRLFIALIKLRFFLPRVPLVENTVADQRSPAKRKFFRWKRL
jgi:hypothetical protein